MLKVVIRPLFLINFILGIIKLVSTRVRFIKKNYLFLKDHDDAQSFRKVNDFFQENKYFKQMFFNLNHFLKMDITKRFSPNYRRC